jgi:hypothetical protein
MTAHGQAFHLVRRLRNLTFASFRRSAVNAILAPMTITASVALKLPGAIQLMQVPMTDGTSYIVAVSFELPCLNGFFLPRVNPLSSQGSMTTADAATSCNLVALRHPMARQ